MTTEKIKQSNDQAIQAWDQQIQVFEALVAELATMNTEAKKNLKKSKG